MSIRNSRHAAALALKSAELAYAAPQVIAQRTAMMIRAGATPSRRDRTEFHRMGAEKVGAFSRAWMAMAMQGWQMNQQIALAVLRTASSPWQWGQVGAHTAPLAALLGDGSLAVLGKGIEPVHAVATANLRRLSRRR
jgi:hypothetical protein